MLVKSFDATIQERIKEDQEFAIALLSEAVLSLSTGEPKIARLILREIVNARVGFEPLAKLTKIPSKSLHRMLSTKGNPTMDNLSLILNTLRKICSAKKEVNKDIAPDYNLAR